MVPLPCIHAWLYTPHHSSIKLKYKALRENWELQFERKQLLFGGLFSVKHELGCRQCPENKGQYDGWMEQTKIE